jgi:peptidyl-prolyl cis-trans isomerase-like protein 2
MANAGSGTNKRQFFITFKSSPHLDRKHTVFGEVVDGQPLLEKLQKFQTDKKERPLEEITILKMEILVDPAREAEDLEQTRMQTLVEARQAEEEQKKAKALGKMKSTTKTTTSGDTSQGDRSTSSVIGKYLPASVVPTTKATQDKDDDGFPILPAPAAKAKVPPKANTFGNFSGW